MTLVAFQGINRNPNCDNLRKKTSIAVKVCTLCEIPSKSIEVTRFDLFKFCIELRLITDRYEKGVFTANFSN